MMLHMYHDIVVNLQSLAPTILSQPKHTKNTHSTSTHMKHTLTITAHVCMHMLS
jgi:hypothetical protein